MSLVSTRRQPAFRPLAARAVSGGPVAPEIAFLREYGVRPELLETAMRDALRQGVEPLQALLASDAVSDTLFYKSLAHLVDAPFRVEVGPLDPGTDALRAVRDGRLRCADGTWLLAPTGATLRLLLEGARTPDLVPRPIAITTPACLEALVLRRAGAGLARRASLALPTLQPALSARGALDAKAVAVALAVLAATATMFVLLPVVLAAVAGLIFLAAVGFRLRVCVAGLEQDDRIAADPALPDIALPRYSILVPLHREAGMVRDLVRHLGALDYPAAKLEIMFLVEADDISTRAALAAVQRPHRMRIVAVPPGAPRTKPRALDVGLALARGSLVTVYDAEDRPEPKQLRAAAARYASASPRLGCLQGRLAISPDARLLPRLFALEYAALFDLYNVGLARLGLPMPLGGTSNHFRVSALRAVGGWDAWNVTEDADLGLKLARFGFTTGVLDSTTFEEAPARLGIWMKQRRRWTKGWMQVALVLARDPSVWRDLGPTHAAAVTLMLISLVIGPLASPAVVLLAFWQIAQGGFGGAEAAWASVVPLAAIVSSLWCGWAGLRARGLGSLAPLLPLLLPYQLLIAVAAWGGLWDLVVRPYHWRKTPHGAEALSRSSRAAPQPRRRGHPPPTPS